MPCMAMSVKKHSPVVSQKRACVFQEVEVRVPWVLRPLPPLVV
jgi:hypothetical protein